MKRYNPGRFYVILLVTCISAFVMLSENSSALPSSRVKNITFDKQQRQEIVIVFLEKLPEIKYFVLHNPERIVVDIKDAFVPQINISQETRGEAVKKIRIGQNSKDTARIILDVNKNIPYIFSILGEMVNDKPAVKIMVSLFQKEENRILSPVINFFDTTEANLKFMEKPIKKNAIKNLEIQKSQEPQKLIGSLVLFDDAMPDDILDQPDKDEKESDLTISCILHVRTTLQTKEEDAVENNTSLRNRILVETKYKSMLTLSVLSDYLYFGREDETSDYDLDLYEAKWQYNEKKYGVSIGKQIIRWGKTDQFSPVDTLNPQDLREFILPEYEERKIPIWMADLNLFFDNFNLEGVFIPFFEESRIDYYDTNWSIFGHMKKELQNAPISPSLKTYFENLSVNENTPDKEAEFALRLTTTVKNMDMGLTFHHTTEDTPYFKSFPVKNISVNGNFSPEGLTSLLDSAILTNEAIEVEYKKTNIAGLEFETIFYDFGFRGEAAWQENESFLTSSLTSTRKSTFTYILGADYTTRNNIYFNLQFAHRHISNYNPEILYFDQNTVSLLGEINKDILVDWLNACLEYNINLNNNAWYLSPQLKYTYITNLECIVGASIFSGDRDTWFGKFKDYDLLFLNIIYHF